MATMVRHQETAVPLMQAAQRLGRAYNPTRDAILRGELAGFQDDRGRWYVLESSLPRRERVPGIEEG